MIGRWPNYQPGSFYSSEGLVNEMNYHGIDEALVFHSLAKDYSPAIGNAELLEQIQGNTRLHPCWVLLPHHTKEMPELRHIIRQMREIGVKAVWLFPIKHNLSLDQELTGDLFSTLNRYKVPLFLDFGNVHWSDRSTDWSAVKRICLDFPDLPVILIHEGIAINRILYPLLEIAENLHLELSYYQVHRGIEDICERFGPEHLLFGSGMPIYSPGPPITMVTYSNISEEAKRLIAGDNLRNLLGNSRLSELLDEETQ
jgi:predicted TIM-barrel fold metal-dependent hydrolase